MNRKMRISASVSRRLSLSNRVSEQEMRISASLSRSLSRSLSLSNRVSEQKNENKCKSKSQSEF